MMIFFPVKQVIRDNRNWIMMAFTIFIVSAFAFYLTTSLAPAEVDQAAGTPLEELLGFVSLLMETEPFISALLIFMNNFISMAQMLILGVVAGISPLFTLGVNGALIGVMLSVTVQEGVPLLPIVLYGILPHGIFELSAFFLCGAIGLKFGYHCIASPLPGKNRMQSFRYIWKEAISIIPIVVGLLLAAAFIEMLITPHLIVRVL
ncbi:MAG: stage II sporulation protein M [Dethiobacteria bacterium]|nr:stage II sporulation protein M [Bacillota bacterium]MDW7728538.1 stage II sporulation protein M [Bacillota bacterium]